MYRAVTWWLLTHGADVTDEAQVTALARTPQLTISTDPDDPRIRVGDLDVSREIRTREVTTSVSAVASVPAVREHLIAQQRAIIAAAGDIGIVAEGRDIGTVVAPDADVKVYLTADSAARAVRHAADQGTSVAQTESDQARRDRLDAAQSAKAPDATLLDSTDLTLDQVVAAIVDLTRRIPEKTR
jgi:cytidylate kinase